MSFLYYLIRYFTARSLWNAVHQQERAVHQRRGVTAVDYRWAEGDEIILKQRKGTDMHMVFSDGKFVAWTPSEAGA